MNKWNNYHHHYHLQKILIKPESSCYITNFWKSVLRKNYEPQKQESVKHSQGKKKKKVANRSCIHVGPDLAKTSK